MGHGYISAALLARFDANATFPRLPFEPISRTEYEQQILDVGHRRVADDFHQALRKYDSAAVELESSSACTSQACILQAERHEALAAV